jgi:phosphopantothenoylcysteine decarboxylase / phosphopantothenate---cysteine ligase
VVNPVGKGLGFGGVENEAVVYSREGAHTPIPRGSKESLAEVVWNLVAARFTRPLLD